MPMGGVSMIVGRACWGSGVGREVRVMPSVSIWRNPWKVADVKGESRKSEEKKRQMKRQLGREGGRGKTRDFERR